MINLLFSITASVSLTAAFIMLFKNRVVKRYGFRMIYVLSLVLAIRMVIPYSVQFPNAFRFTVRIPSVVIRLWVLGAVVFALYHIGGFFWFERKIRRNGRVIKTDKVCTIFKRVKAEMYIGKDIELLSLKDISSPMLVRYFHPVIILPEGKCGIQNRRTESNPNLKTEYSPKEYEMIFRHELTHYEKKDNFKKLFFTLAASTQWFNPLSYLLMKEAFQSLECVCDEIVTAKEDMDFKRDYCLMLLSTGQKNSLPYPAVSYFGTKEKLKTRISNIFEKRTKRKGVIPTLSVLMSVVLLSGLLCSCTVETPQDVKEEMDRIEKGVANERENRLESGGTNEEGNNTGSSGTNEEDSYIESDGTNEDGNKTGSDRTNGQGNDTENGGTSGTTSPGILATNLDLSPVSEVTQNAEKEIQQLNAVDGIFKFDDTRTNIPKKDSFPIYDIKVGAEIRTAEDAYAQYYYLEEEYLGSHYSPETITAVYSHQDENGKWEREDVSLSESLKRGDVPAAILQMTPIGDNSKKDVAPYGQIEWMSASPRLWKTKRLKELSEMYDTGYDGQSKPSAFVRSNDNVDENVYAALVSEGTMQEKHKLYEGEISFQEAAECFKNLLETHPYRKDDKMSFRPHKFELRTTDDFCTLTVYMLQYIDGVPITGVYTEKEKKPLGFTYLCPVSEFGSECMFISPGRPDFIIFNGWNTEFVPRSGQEMTKIISLKKAFDIIKEELSNEVVYHVYDIVLGNAVVCEDEKETVKRTLPVWKISLKSGTTELEVVINAVTGENYVADITYFSSSYLR